VIRQTILLNGQLNAGDIRPCRVQRLQ
jgi:hypothetical protein